MRRTTLALLAACFLLPGVRGQVMDHAGALPKHGKGQVEGAQAQPNSGKVTAAIPPDCDKPLLLSKGRPIMTRKGKGLALGVSLEKHKFVAGKPILLHIWADNNSDVRVGVWTCMDLDYFKSRGFDLYDAHGHRVLRRGEAELLQKCRVDPALAVAMRQWVCSRNFPIFIPAHSCVSEDDSDFTTDLTGSYDLPPGKYTLRFRHWQSRNTDVCKKLMEPANENESGPELIFSVVQP